VATALGVLIGINPLLGLAVLVTWLIVAYLSRYSSLAALIAAVCAPVYYGIGLGADAILGAIVVMSALLLYRHAGNISNLMAGKESKIGSKSAGATVKKK
jgi:glycerol-3-phosphate acyltransferase PlsY